ncbi:MAG: hypothetical protein J0I88_07035, partial [Chryseobacterium sp.]|nr:hypothetical protein [Chryseobacterium sp.]
MLKAIAPIAVEILFCVDSESLSLTKGVAKKITTESGIKLLKKLFNRLHRNCIAAASYQVNRQFCFAVNCF